MIDLTELKKYTNIYDDLVQADLIQAVREGQKVSNVIDAIIDIDMSRMSIQYGMYRRSLLEPATMQVTDNMSDPRKFNGVPILNRPNTHELKVNHKNHTPFDTSIVNNKTGYFIGKKVNVTSEDNDDIIKQFINDNDLDAKLMTAASDAVDQGEGFILLSSPEGLNDIELVNQKSFHCVVLYENMIPVYGLVYHQTLTDSSEYKCYWYDVKNATPFSGSQSDLVKGKEVNHLFNGVPLIEFANNSNRIGDVELTIGLQDVYDIIDSDLTSEISQLRLAYLMLDGFGVFTDNDDDNKKLIEMFKKTGLLLGDSSDGSKVDAKFIEKNLNYQAIEYAKNDLQRRIYKHSNSYDPDALAGIGSTVTAFQIRMMFNALEQSTIKTEVEFRKALKYMFKLIAGYYNTYNSKKGFDAEKLTINFTRNRPSNINQDVLDAKTAGWNFSQETLSTLIPLEVDQEVNKQQLEDEQEMINNTILESNVKANEELDG